MPFWLHLTLAILITAYFTFRFIKEKYTYELLFIIWVPSTLLQYISSNRIFTLTLGIFQVIMFILVIFFMFKNKDRSRKKTLEILAEAAAESIDSEEESK